MCASRMARLRSRTREARTMTQADLQKALRAIDPAAVLVSSRILERVVRDELQLPTMSWNIPHGKSYVCDRQVLFRHAEQADLELEPDQLLPDEVILLIRPDADEMSNLERKPLLLKYWRRLFHSRIHVALGASNRGKLLTAEGVRSRVEEIGQSEFEEIRQVLTQDNYLPPGADDASTYHEFAAVYLELRYFGANLLPNYFPGIRDFGRIEVLLGKDIDAAGLFAQTRLKDAPDPVLPADTRSEESQEAYWKLVRMAQSAANSGNIVKAAILRIRASRIAPAAQTLPTRREAEGDVARLSERLAAALDLGETERQEWPRYMTLLLDKADQGVHPMEARVLEDLQQVCLDHEQEVYTLDLVEFLFSGGKRPIKRKLPSQRLVRISLHLRAALAKLGRVRLSDTDRGHLTRLLQLAQTRTDVSLQSRFRPVLVTALEDVGLKPMSPLQHVAFTKMVDELLDRISSYGYLTFAELRDTISRNQLKLPDLTEPEHFVRGDPLIRLDRRLGSLLDGVYRPGEFYVRWLERFTSIKFGTWWGRTITRWVTLPLLIAWLVLFVAGFLLTFFFSAEKFPEVYTAGLVLMGPAHGEKARPEVAEGVHTPDPPALGGGLAEEVHTPDPPAPPSPLWLGWHLMILGGMTTLVLLLLQVESFRRRCWRAVRFCWYGLIATCYAAKRVLPFDALRRLSESWVFKLFYWYVFRPAIVTALVFLLWPSELLHWYGLGATYVVLAVLLNSRIGRSASEWFEDGLVRLGEVIRGGLVPGLIRFIVYAFKQVVESIEYTLFVVDEWLRFRGGDSRWSLVIRTLAGLLWAPIAFLVRFFMIVLIEPGYNPLKAPISLLAAKVMAPLTYKLMSDFAPSLVEGWPTPFKQIAWAALVAVIWHLCDVFGFLYWEMKENWALYRSNRGQLIQPAGIGAHNETMRGLLVPGFHSGTVPHLFARLRIAEKAATKSLNWNPARVNRQQLEELASALEHFVTREMVALLLQHPTWRGKKIDVGPVRLATNRIRLELGHEDHPAHPVEIEIAYQTGWILASVRSVGWLETQEPAAVRVFAICLAYLYRRANVDLVREQMLGQLDMPASSLQLTGEGLLVGASATDRTAIDLREIMDDPTRGEEVRRLVFSETPIRWADWTDAWHQGGGSPHVATVVELAESLLRIPRPPAPLPLAETAPLTNGAEGVPMSEGIATA